MISAPRPLVLALGVALVALVSAADADAQRRKSRAPAVSPQCADLYAHANAAWLKTHQAPADAGAVTALGQLSELALQQQRQLLDAAMASPDNDVQHRLGDFWASGLDEAAVEADGSRPIATLLSRIDAIGKSRDVPATIAALHQVGIPVAFNFAPDVDLQALDRHIGYFMQGGMGLPDPAFYTRDDADTRVVMDRYRAYVRQILALTGTPEQRLDGDVAAVITIETALARKSRSLNELNSPADNFAPVPVAQAAKRYRNLQLDKFLAAQGVKDDRVSMANPALFAELDAMVGKLKPEQWRAYLRWRVGDAMAPYLSRSYRDASFGFRGRVLEGRSVQAPRWRQVLDAINVAAGPMLGREYAAAHLQPEERRQAGLVVDELRQALLAAVDASSWLGAPAKAEARAKLEAMAIEVGTPRRDLDYTVQPMGRGSFGGNMLIASTWRPREEMKRIGRGNADRRWDVLPQQPALAYDLAQNRLIVTAAMLQAPVLDAGMAPAAQYGGYGALVGHELSHAVDARGRMVDAKGELRDWWTGTEAAAWDANVQKVATLYDGFAYPQLKGVKVNGRLTRDENIADIAGLELARAALVAALPSGGAQADKDFYRGWAQVWAQQVTMDEAQRRSLQDVRAPGPWRGNAPIMQQGAFGTAYACKAGTPMQPKVEQRVGIFR